MRFSRLLLPGIASLLLAYIVLELLPIALGSAYDYMPLVSDTPPTILGVRYDHTMRTVAIGSAILGMVSGVLGSFAVLRHESLMGDALSHAALPGVAIAFLLTGRELTWLLVGAGIASWLAVMLINAILKTTRIKQDAALGLTLSAFFAIGLVLLTYIQSREEANKAGLDSFIFGQAAAIVRSDVRLIASVGAVAFIIMALFWKEFKLVTFDAEFARANGYPLRILEILLSTLIVIAIVLGLQLAGVILMVGLLIAPGVAARQWTNRLDQMIWLSAFFGALAGISGAFISGLDADLPTGPLIIVIAFGMVFMSVNFAPDRGIIWQLWRRRYDRQRFAAQNILRDIYRHALRHEDPHYPAPEGLLVATRGSGARLALKKLQHQGLVTRIDDATWALTPPGLELAQQKAHNERLWELYREYGVDLGLPVISEDRNQDIRRLLPHDSVTRLEKLLEAN